MDLRHRKVRRSREFTTFLCLLFLLLLDILLIKTLLPPKFEPSVARQHKELAVSLHILQQRRAFAAQASAEELIITETHRNLRLQNKLLAAVKTAERFSVLWCPNSGKPVLLDDVLQADGSRQVVRAPLVGDAAQHELTAALGYSVWLASHRPSRTAHRETEDLDTDMLGLKTSKVLQRDVPLVLKVSHIALAYKAQRPHPSSLSSTVTFTHLVNPTSQGPFEASSSVFQEKIMHQTLKLAQDRAFLEGLQVDILAPYFDEDQSLIKPPFRKTSPCPLSRYAVDTKQRRLCFVHDIVQAALNSKFLCSPHLVTLASLSSLSLSHSRSTVRGTVVIRVDTQVMSGEN